MSTAKATPKPAPEPEPELPDGASVQTVGDETSSMGVWHLVTYGTWQISVGPDGLLYLPRHLHPREWADFMTCGSIAANVGTKVVAENVEKARRDDRSLPPGQAIVREGAPPAGTMRMLTTPGPAASRQQQAATIGRPRRNGRRAAPPGAMI